jgi:hypothetical protein
LGIDVYLPTYRGKLVQRYEDLRSPSSVLSPQERGIEFQRLIAELTEQEGWEQEEGVRTANEEIDVVLYHDSAVHLIECKWESVPIEAQVVRDFHGKLAKRAGAVGLIFSMSGFTSGAKQESLEWSGQSRILLLDRKDSEAILYGKTSLDSLIKSKVRDWVRRNHQ